MRTRLRRLPIAVGVGALGWLLDGPLAALVFGFAVVVLPEVQPWISARLGPGRRKPGDVTASLRLPSGNWLAGIATPLPDGGLRWRAANDEGEGRRLGRDFTFAGFLGEVRGLQVVELVGPDGPVELGVAPADATRVAALFRLR